METQTPNLPFDKMYLGVLSIFQAYMCHFLWCRTWIIPFKLSPPSAAYKCQWIESALVQIMACRLFGAKPLSKPTLDYYQMDP